jgi:hypothetical protein
MRTILQNSLLVASITFLSGGAACYLLPSGGTASALAGSTAGAAATSMIVNRQKRKNENSLRNEAISILATENTNEFLIKNPLELDINSVHLPILAKNEIQVSSLEPVQLLEEKSTDPKTKEINKAVTFKQDNSEMFSDSIEAWLRSRDILVEEIFYTPQPEDHFLDDLSIFIAKNRLMLASVSKKIITDVQIKNSELEYDFEEIETVVKEFFKKLVKTKLLEKFRFDKGKIIILFNQYRSKKFFESGWFQRYIHHEISCLLSDAGLNYQSIIDVKIITNEIQSKQDILFRIEQRLVCIKCKTQSSYHEEDKTRYIELMSKISETQGKLFFITFKASTLEGQNDDFESIVFANKSNFIQKIRELLKLPPLKHPKIYLDEKQKNITPKPALLLPDHSLSLGCEDAKQWLTSKGFEIGCHYQGEPTQDEVFNHAALLIGNYYSYLSPLISQIVYYIKNKPEKRLRYSLSNQSMEGSKICKQFCEGINGYLITRYIYDSNTESICTNLLTPVEVFRFFEGTWFERFINQKILQILSKNSIEYHQLVNVNFKFENIKTFHTQSGELDLFYLINKLPFLVECKSGKRDYESDIQKYDMYSRLLKIRKNSSIYIALNMLDDQRDFFNTTYKFLTVVNGNNYLQILQSAITSLQSAE